jgi:hypothetical protein
MEGHVADRDATALGVRAFTDIASALANRLDEAGAPADRATISALMAMLERSAYFLVSRQLEVDADELLDSLTTLVHRGFFGASVAA